VHAGGVSDGRRQKTGGGRRKGREAGGDRERLSGLFSLSRLFRAFSSMNEINPTNQINQTNQMNKTDEQELRADG
jgi:hypothetical protein